MATKPSPFAPRSRQRGEPGWLPYVVSRNAVLRCNNEPDPAFQRLNHAGGPYERIHGIQTAMQALEPMVQQLKQDSINDGRGYEFVDNVLKELHEFNQELRMWSMSFIPHGQPVTTNLVRKRHDLSERVYRARFVWDQVKGKDKEAVLQIHEFTANRMYSMAQDLKREIKRRSEVPQNVKDYVTQVKDRADDCLDNEIRDCSEGMIIDEIFEMTGYLNMLSQLQERFGTSRVHQSVAGSSASVEGGGQQHQHAMHALGKQHYARDRASMRARRSR